MNGGDIPIFEVFGGYTKTSGDAGGRTNIDRAAGTDIETVYGGCSDNDGSAVKNEVTIIKVNARKIYGGITTLAARLRSTRRCRRLTEPPA